MLERLGSRLETLAVLTTLAILLGIASPHFLTTDNLLNVVQQSAINAVLGIGLTFVIISAGIDLSVGSILALCGIVVADLLVSGVPVGLSVLAGMGIGLACGIVNGLITTLGRIPPFIATLGMMLVARSAAKIYSGSSPISGLPGTFRALSGDVAGIPIPVIVVVLFYAVAHVVLTRTRLGRYTYAIGGNEQAAWLSGVPTARYTVAIYGLSGLLAGVAAILMTSRLNAASPLAGEMYELYAIAAAVIGGVSLMGGEGRVMGTLIGALVMGTLRNGLNLLNVPSAWEGVVVGLVLVTAVVIDRSRHREGVPLTGLRRYRGKLIAAAVAVLLAAFAFGYRISLQPSAEQSGGRRIAFIPKSLGDPFWVTMQKAAEREAAKYGATVITLAAERETDVERQFQVIENVVEQGVNAILLAPAGSREVVVAIKKANDAGIPVIILDSDIDHDTAREVGAETVTYIGSDNFLGGSIAGRYLVERLDGRGQIAVIEGTAGHESTDQRRLGFLEAIAEHPGVEIVASLTANAERERGYTVAQNILQSHPDLDAIFACNDQMALGALEAVDAAHRLDEVRVVGFDAAPDALENIKAGRMLGSVAQYPSEMGRLGVYHAMRVLEEQARPPRVVHTKVEMIDASNVATVSSSAQAGRRIAIVTHDRRNPYWKLLVEGVRAGAGADTEIIWRAPDSPYDVEEQFGIVSDVIAQGIDGVLLVPAGARTMTTAARLANEAAVPLLIVDSPLDASAMTRMGVTTLGFVGSDNRAGGALAARHAATLLPEGGRVAILRGTPGNASTHARAEGFIAALGELTLIAEPVAYAERGIARVVTQSLLDEHANLDLIFATNGEMALGASDVLEERAVKLIAFDGTEEVLAALKTGRIDATIAQQPEVMGRRAIEILATRLGSERPPAAVEVLTETRLVTPTTGDEQ